MCCCCCSLHIKNRSDLSSIRSNIRNGPTEPNAFKKGTYYEKSKKDKGLKKVNTNAIIGKKQKNKAPDSQTSQVTCLTEEINRAHRSHSTREAKQNEALEKNQGSPIKTIKLHNSILVRACYGL